MTYAFSFDASACTGCKACQVACKDKNNLPLGVLWRRVYEISGGSWSNVGTRTSGTEVWQTDVFAYHLSMSCNHCIHPKCAGVCPTDAYVVRQDGIVFIDGSKCIGCGYCAWACPYSAPQFDPESRCMTKCNFCFDEIDAGLPPACVAACPMRVLDITTVENGTWREQSKTPLWEVPGNEHPFPLPSYSRTQPNLAIRPHSAMKNELEKTIANKEEIQPRLKDRRWKLGELPLVAFTLCGQMAAGIALLAMFSGPLTFSLLALIAVLILMGGLASFLHLGAPWNSWRVLGNLKKSRLSREILALGFFMASWFVALALPGMGKFPLAVAGVALVISMAKVYQLHSVQSWRLPVTLMAFSVSAVLLGGLAYLVEGFFTHSGNEWRIVFAQASVAVGLLAALLLSLKDQNFRTVPGRTRSALTVLALAGFGLAVLFPISARWLILPVFLISVSGEFLGRWLFYASRNPLL
jgi:anaerobic dimethyl sulfoxide reductase subunit B (iron-sulfur subunit)